MRLTRRRWIGPLVILLGIGGWWVMNSEGEKPLATPKAPPAAISSEPHGPQGRLQGAILVEQDETSSAWEVYAEEASLFETKGLAVAQGVRAELFQDQQTLLWLQADEGKVHRQSGDIAVKGHVEVKHQAGYTIRTDALDWKAKNRSLQTDENVDIQGQSVRVTGKGLRSDVDQQQFSLQQDVRASFQLQPGQLGNRHRQAGQK